MTTLKGAMALAFQHFKLVLEPGGAVALACACLNREQFRDQTVVVVASGGNVDPEKYAGWLQEGMMHKSRLLGLDRA